MNQERWQELKGEMKDKFSDVEEESGELDGSPGSFEQLIFSGPMGRIKLEFVTRPLVLDKKTTTSKRIGSEVAVEYIYSPDEFTHKLYVYKLNEATDEWEEIKANMFSGG